MVSVSKSVGWEITKKSFLPVGLLVLLMAGHVYYRFSVFPVISEQVHLELKKYIATIFVISVTFVIQRILGAVLSWYQENIACKTLTKLDDKLIPIARRTFKVIIWICASLIILPFFKINISALVATLGVGSLAIALAAQDTIANIISGFMIMIDSPFRISDRIKLPSGEVVTVLDIGVRRSEFLSEDKAIIIVPNLDLSKSKIVNYTYGEERAK